MCPSSTLSAHHACVTSCCNLSSIGSQKKESLVWLQLLESIPACPLELFLLLMFWCFSKLAWDFNCIFFSCLNWIECVSHFPIKFTSVFVQTCTPKQSQCLVYEHESKWWICQWDIGPQAEPVWCWWVGRVGSQNITVHFWLDDRPCGNYLWVLVTLKMTIWVESTLLCLKVYHWRCQWYTSDTDSILISTGFVLTLPPSTFHPGRWHFDSARCSQCNPAVFTLNRHVLTRIWVLKTILHFSPQMVTFSLSSASKS